MLTLYTGTPGSGKSYTAADRIDRALRRGMPVIANFEININPKKHKGEFVFVDTLQLTPEFLMDYAQKHFDPKKGENQGLIFIDEAQIPFNPRTGYGSNDQKSRMAWINFFSKHRHYFWDVILIAQHDRMIDRQIRSLIEVERKHRDLRNYGVKGLYMMMIFHKRFVQVSYWYPIQEKIGSEFFSLKKRVCRLYDTFKKFENDKTDTNTADGAVRKRKMAELYQMIDTLENDKIDANAADRRTDDEERKRKIAEFNKKVSDLS